MAKYLVIVESPAKAKTIKKFLGTNYKVEASMGHLRDLPKSQFGVDLENSFEPKYINIRGKGELIKKLKKESKNTNKVFLATDPDREGEAISWHLANILDISEDSLCRVTFNEITKDTIKKSIKSPRKIDMDLVESQQTRRILDRIVGYKISPLLWKNVKKGLSAGRVQSVAVKIICDREKEIEEFVPEEYWSLNAMFKKKTNKFIGKFYGTKDKKIELKNAEQVKSIKQQLEDSDYIVDKVKRGEKKKNTLPPFTTSLLQQEAYKKLGYTAKKTMMLAQKLYEGIDLKDSTVGLITYMRTDSTRISAEAQQTAKEYISVTFGEQYVPKEAKKYKAKIGAQDAHEAIRPTYIDKDPENIKQYLSNDMYKLYKLIWQRFLASQMENAIYNTISVDVAAGDYLFKISGLSIKFDGFLKVYSSEKEESENSNLPDLEEKEILKCESVDEQQHFTQPPARYTDASLVKILEEKGIGRPSTYVPVIETIIERGYAVRDKKALMPTDLGIIVNGLMIKFFSDILNEKFTANMEDNLDGIESGKYNWKKVLADFYSSFEGALHDAETNMEPSNYFQPVEVTDEICEKCGRNMVLKMGRFGKFLACPGFPECKNTKPYYEKTDIKCPKCGGVIVEKVSKKRMKYYACINAECKAVFWGKPINEKCPACGDELIKSDKVIKCNNSKCKYKRPIEKTDEKENGNGDES